MAGKTIDEGTLYAIGRIVLFAPKSSPLQVDADLADLRAALADGRVQRFAIANPEHAPYGRAAEEALRSRGLWDAIRPKLVLGEYFSQAAQFATTGEAQGGSSPTRSPSRPPSATSASTCCFRPSGTSRCASAWC